MPTIFPTLAPDAGFSLDQALKTIDDAGSSSARMQAAADALHSMGFERVVATLRDATFSPTMVVTAGPGQDGYELDAPIPVYVKQDGSFEAELFDGVYKLVTRDQNGPWVNSRDTTLVTLDGHTQISLEVTPYFTISDVSLTLEGEAKLRGSFTIGRVSPDARVEYAMLLIAKTTFVDDVVNLERIDISDPAAGSSIQLSLDASGNENVVNSKALFARVGVRTVGADQAIYSEVVQVR